MSGYCFDTSAFMEAWLHTYPIQVFPGVWSRIDSLISTGRLVASVMVRDELQAKSDALSAWARDRRDLFVPVDKEQSDEAQSIVRTYRRLIEERRGRTQADPFVIALARLRGLVCVTEEQFGNETNVRIPFVCQQLGLESIKLVDLMMREGWQF